MSASLLAAAVLLPSAYHVGTMPSHTGGARSVVRMVASTTQPADTQQADLVKTICEIEADEQYARVQQLNKYATVELELLRTQNDNRALRDRMNPKRRATFLVPFSALCVWTGGKIVTAPDFDFPGLDSIKEYARERRIDGPAEDAMRAYFPNSLGSYTVEHLVYATLEKRGYTSDNTLFATSTCPDEVNTKVGELCDLFKIRWGENFGLGGLGGVPFTGKAGFSAYSHHVPEKGKMFILFAPHVGVEFDGKVGALRRINQQDVSTACGATIGAYNGIVKDAIAKGQVVGSLEEELGDEKAYGVSTANNDAFDAQILFIKEQLASRLAGLSDAPDQVSFVTYAMYQLVREFFIDELLSAPGFWDYADEVTVLGGIMVNRGRGGDRFMPLMFQTRQQAAGSTEDLQANLWRDTRLAAGLRGGQR